MTPAPIPRLACSPRLAGTVSILGAVDVEMQCLLGSALPMNRAALATISARSARPRILPCGISERFARRGDGELELLTEGSTAAVAEVRHHVGIVSATPSACSDECRIASASSILAPLTELFPQAQNEERVDNQIAKVPIELV